MNTPINDGGPAFPVLDLSKTQCSGMSLRDWLAGQALASSFSEAVKLMPNKLSAQDYAESLYGIADAMIAAREVKP